MGFRHLLTQLRQKCSRRSASHLVGVRSARIEATLAEGTGVRARAPQRLANWLEDALRMRPACRSRASATHDATFPLALMTRRQEVAALTGHLSSEVDDSAHVAHTGHTEPLPNLRAAATRPRPASTPDALDAPAAADVAGAPAADERADIDTDDQLDALDGMDAMQRRLVLIRHLVRQRVYNEGFALDETPEQYRWPAQPHIPPTAE